jgi:uncharacterized protein (TIGR02453 family)
MLTPVFTPKALAFLRALERNNDREWFKARKPDYDAHIHGPMVQLLTRLEQDLLAFAPELVSHPKISLFRIYRDTRFSANKTPLKTTAAAHFPHRQLQKRGAALYFEIAPTRVGIGGGVYMPERLDLHAIRERIATHHRTLRRIVGAKAFTAVGGGLKGEQLTRVPRGYPPDHAAADLLRHKQFLATQTYPAEFAFDPEFYPELLRVLRAVAPLIRFLNNALLSAPGRQREAERA